jgi:hypothetical protein
MNSRKLKKMWFSGLNFTHSLLVSIDHMLVDYLDEWGDLIFVEKVLFGWNETR